MTIKKYVFIGGLHSSGTTLLHDLMCAHPDVSGFTGTNVSRNEGQHLQTVFLPAYTYEGGVGKFAFHPQSHLNETSPLITMENRMRLYDQWNRHWDMNKRCLIEKSPPNIVRMRFLQAMFYDSYFIIMLRHPLAAGYSMQQWRAYDALTGIKHWYAAHEILLEDLPHIKNCILIRYEDFVLQPEYYMKRVYAGLKLPACPIHETIHKNTNDRYYKLWEHDLSLDAELLPNAMEYIGMQTRFGYTLTNPYVGAISTDIPTEQGSFAG